MGSYVLSSRQRYLGECAGKYVDREIHFGYQMGIQVEVCFLDSLSSLLWTVWHIAVVVGGAD